MRWTCNFYYLSFLLGKTEGRSWELLWYSVNDPRSYMSRELSGSFSSCKPSPTSPLGLCNIANNFWHVQILILCCNHAITTGGKIISHLIFFLWGKEAMPISLRGLQKILCKIVSGVQKSKRQKRQPQAASYLPLLISDIIMACSSVAMGPLNECHTFIFAHDTQGRHEPHQCP